MKRLLVPILVTVFIVITMAFMASTPEVTVCEPPEVALGEIDGFTSEKQEPGEAELNILPADTRLDKRLYRAPGGHWFAVSLVIGGTNKSSIHRPELCLPAQGFQMVNPRSAVAGGLSWRFITLAGGAGRPSMGFAYTFFNQDGFHTSSHIRRIFQDVWDRSILNRIDRWVMITINSSISDQRVLEDFISRLKYLKVRTEDGR